MADPLKECPGCGGTDIRVIGGPGTRGGPQYWAGCDHCRWRTWGNTEAEAIEAWNNRHGAGDAEEGLRDLHDSIRTVYDAVPSLPIDETTMDAATDALHAFCLLVGIHKIDIDTPRDDAARAREGEK